MDLDSKNKAGEDLNLGSEIEATPISNQTNQREGSKMRNRRQSLSSILWMPKLYSLNLCNQCLVWDVNRAPPRTFLWMLRRLRKQVHIVMDHSESLDTSNNTGKLSKCISWMIMMLIIVSTIAFVMQTMPELRMSDGREWEGWEIIELVVSIMFTLEYVARFFCCKDKMRFFFGILNIVDLLAILPFYTRIFLDEVC